MPFVQAQALATALGGKADWSARETIIDTLEALGADVSVPVVADCAVAPSGTYAQQEAVDVVTSLNAVIDALQLHGIITAT